MNEIEKYEFTDEANNLIEVYLQKVSIKLFEAKMTPREITDSIEELREHIINYCIIKSGNNQVITTDLIRTAIQKLGDPELIGKTLRNELDFKSEVLLTTKTKSSDKRSYQIRVKDMTSTYTALTWSLFCLYLFYLIGYNKSFFEGLLFFNYLVLFGIFWKVTTNPLYKVNKTLRNGVKMNMISFIVPLAYFLEAAYHIFAEMYLYRGLFISPIFPIFFTLWLITITSEVAKENYKNKITEIRDWIKYNQSPS